MKPKKVLRKKNFKQNQKKKFKIKAHHKKEVGIEIEVMENGDYEIEKLSVDDLPDSIDGHKITWLNNLLGLKTRIA